MDATKVAETVATALGVGTDTLADMPESLLLDAVKAEDIKVQAALFAFVAAVKERKGESRGSTKLLADQFSRTDLRNREPWRLGVENAQAERDAMAKSTQLGQQKLFLELVKAKQVGAQDVMVATYLLYGKPEAQRFYAGVILAKPEAERVRAHNYFVAANVEDPESFIAQNGSILANLPVPLFPPVAECSAYNTALCREFKEYLQAGGGASGGGRNGRKFSTALQARGGGGESVSETAGGSAFPVQQNAQGQWVVDVTPIEDAFRNVYAELNKLADDVKTIKDIKELPRVNSQIETLRTKLGAARSTFRTATRSNGRYRGRGRGRARGGGSDPEQDF